MLASTLFVALSAVAASAAPISLNLVEAAVSTPNSTQTSKVVSYEMNGNAGACAWYNKDSDVVVGLPLEFYSALSTVSPYCGQFVVVKNLESNKTVTALVSDASTQNSTLSVSQGTWKALNGTATDLKTVEWRFANSTETADAKAALSDDSSDESSPSSSSARYVAPSSSSVRASSSSSSAAAYVAPSSSSAAPVQNQKQSEPSTSSYQAPKTTSSTKAYVAPTTSYAPKTTTTSQYVAPKTTTQAPASSGGSGSYSGRATFYSQGGNAGSCGQVNGDYSMIVALNAPQRSENSHCGQWVTIKNTQNGKTVSAKVADTCPGCSYGSLDLSMGAFAAIGDYDQGVLPITWSFN
ncbi:RlpA-like double-psi beta-barrel domain-containing protein [Sporobolomyces salmoneus]|uniref:RlpA-like double-psi beta-barrel domain-containing protein n=1 Tax=Sporobolomyces salmoneus TaxID=183962 RepID=UPI00316B5999